MEVFIDSIEIDLRNTIFHSLILVWKLSFCYGSSSRLVVLVRGLCNVIIKHAAAYFNNSCNINNEDVNNENEKCETKNIGKVFQLLLSSTDESREEKRRKGKREVLDSKF